MLGEGLACTSLHGLGFRPACRHLYAGGLEVARQLSFENGGDVTVRVPSDPACSRSQGSPRWNLEFISTQVTECHVNNEEGVGGGQSVCVPRGLSP